MLGAKVKSTEVIDMTGEGASTKWVLVSETVGWLKLISIRGHTTGRGKKKRRIESDDEEECVYSRIRFSLTPFLIHVKSIHSKVRGDT